GFVVLLDDGALSGCHQPSAVLLGTEDGGEHGGGVEPGQAQPVDASSAGDQRSGVQVRQKCIVTDRSAHTIQVGTITPGSQVDGPAQQEQASAPPLYPVARSILLPPGRAPRARLSAAGIALIESRQ